MQELIRQLLGELGEDPSREGLRTTPKRVEKALRFLTSGYDADIDTVLNEALFTVDYSEMVIVKDIDFYSLCEHHLLPFFGKCHVAYIPTTRVIGLSKIPRLVDVFSRRLQVQERLTSQIAETIREKVAPLGVAVVMEATHLCMSMRGVESTLVGDRNDAICVMGAAGSPATRMLDVPVVVRTANVVLAFVRLYASTLSSICLPPPMLKRRPPRMSSVGSQGSSTLPLGSALTPGLAIVCLTQVDVTVAEQV